MGDGEAVDGNPSVKIPEALQVASLSNWATYPAGICSCDHVEVF